MEDLVVIMARTVLLTGGTGFLGSHICEQLVRGGDKVIILKRKYSDTWRIKHLLNRLVLYNSDEADFSSIFREQNINAVIHTSTNYGRNGEQPHEIFQSNVIFPLTLLEAAVNFNTDTFINTDTVLYEYLNFYSLSKKHFSDLLKIYAKNIKVFNLRLEHVYGDKDGRDKFISMVIDSFLSNKERIQLTVGDQKRDFIYVDDVVSAYVEILDRAQNFEKSYIEYSIGSGISISIREIVELIRKLTFNSVTKTEFGAIKYRDNEIMQSVADISKAREEIQWFPQYDLETGLKMTIQWYKKRYYSQIGGIA
jgi:nucleoside-diphosphate-sugar epimerase